MTAAWFVVCDDYQRGPFPSQQAAEAARDRIEAFGQCDQDHRVVKG